MDTIGRDELPPPSQPIDLTEIYDATARQRGNKEFLAHHTISEDRTKDSTHEKAQLLALQEKRKSRELESERLVEYGAGEIEEIIVRSRSRSPERRQVGRGEVIIRSRSRSPERRRVGREEIIIRRPSPSPERPRQRRGRDYIHSRPDEVEREEIAIRSDSPSPERPRQHRGSDMDKGYSTPSRRRTRFSRDSPISESDDYTQYVRQRRSRREEDREKALRNGDMESIELPSGLNFEDARSGRMYGRSARVTSGKYFESELSDLSGHDDWIHSRGARSNGQWPGLLNSKRGNGRCSPELEPLTSPHSSTGQILKASDTVVQENGIYFHDNFDQLIHPIARTEVRTSPLAGPRRENVAPPVPEQPNGQQDSGTTVPSIACLLDEYLDTSREALQVVAGSSNSDDELPRKDEPQLVSSYIHKSRDLRVQLGSRLFQQEALDISPSLSLEHGEHNLSELQSRLSDQDHGRSRRRPGVRQQKGKGSLSEKPRGAGLKTANDANADNEQKDPGLPRIKPTGSTSRCGVESAARTSSATEGAIASDKDANQNANRIASIGDAHPSIASIPGANSADEAPQLPSRQGATTRVGDNEKLQVNISHGKGQLRQAQDTNKNPVSVDRLYQEIERYRREINYMRSSQPLRPRPRRQIIHRVRRNDYADVWDHWLDPPRWLVGDRGQKSIKGSLPLSDVENYVQRHPELAFMVYREYDRKDEQNAFESTVGSWRNNSSQTGEGTPVPSGESITICSEDLYETCDKVFSRLPYKPDSFKAKGYYELHAPYLFIYHSRRVLSDSASQLKGQQLSCWKLLIRYIFDEFGKEFSRADALISNGNISNKFMKYLFRPKDVLICHEGGQHLGHMATSWLKAEVSMGKPLNKIGEGPDQPDGEESRGPNAQKVSWEIQTYCWRYNGSFYKTRVTVKVSSNLRPHEEMPIRDLNVYPFDYADKKICDLLSLRGNTFWKCRNQRYVAYDSPGEQDGAKNMDSRYMIDMKTYKMLHTGPRENFVAVEAELDSASMAADELPQEPFVFLLPNEIKGYNLRTKKWGKFDLEVDRVVDISWNVTAFESLVTDDRTKELIHALVTNQLVAEKATDLIAGKGNGLIMLLHGGPGTGKTFTAESVAEIAQKPLYRVTCGDIGTDPEQVEKYLESVLHLGKIWNCVVLLDEADIFLEERTLADLQRNALVSTFLRALEYYGGILILTSNRVGHFDEAFKSRIQLALHYKNLDQRQRRQIWRNFLQRLKDLKEKDVNFRDLDKHIDDLAENQMNGRQIRNAITTARQLAIYRKRDLDYQSLQDVIETSSMFDKYLLELNEGNSDDAIARGMGNRL